VCVCVCVCVRPPPRGVERCCMLTGAYVSNCVSVPDRSISTHSRAVCVCVCFYPQRASTRPNQNTRSVWSPTGWSSARYRTNGRLWQGKTPLRLKKPWEEPGSLGVSHPPMGCKPNTRVSDAYVSTWVPGWPCWVCENNISFSYLSFICASPSDTPTRRSNQKSPNPVKYTAVVHHQLSQPFGPLDPLY